VPTAARPSRSPEGVTLCHRSRCATRSGRPCDCRPAYQAQVYSPRDRKTLRKTFGSLTDARAWRSETHAALTRGTLRAPSRTTLEQAAEEWLRAAEAGVVRTRSGDPYKPSALRGYEQALRRKLLLSLGHLRLSAVTRNAVQDLVDRLVAEGAGASTVRNAVPPAAGDLPPRYVPLRGPRQPDRGARPAGGARQTRAGRASG